MDNSENRSFDFLNLINILSFWIAVMNLEQNIEQSKEQDINKSNEKQQKEILDNIHKQFEKQNQLLYSLEKKIDELLKGGR